MKAEQLYSEAKYALCEMPPDFEKAKQLLDEYRKDKNDDVLNQLLLQLVMDYPLNSWECEACEDDIECVKACLKYTLKYTRNRSSSKKAFVMGCIPLNGQ